MRFVGIVLLIGLVAGCSPKQPVPVRIGYVETDVPSSSQCVEITGAFQGRPYQLRMAYSQNGKVSYKILNETPCFMQDTDFAPTDGSRASPQTYGTFYIECRFFTNNQGDRTGRYPALYLIGNLSRPPFFYFRYDPAYFLHQWCFARNTGRRKITTGRQLLRCTECQTVAARVA